MEPTRSVTEQVFSLNKAFRLSAVQQSSLEGEITEQELLIPSQQENHLVLYIDGNSIEVYKTFNEEHFSFQQGILSLTQREGIISFLLKSRGKIYRSNASRKNWRPLTLFCCNTYILSKCISLKVKTIIGSIIIIKLVLLMADSFEII